MITLLKQIALGLMGVMPGNYSGITHVHDDVYAVVDDKDEVDGFKYLTLGIDSVSGAVKHAFISEPVGMLQRRSRGVANYRDCEGVAYYPERNTVFVSGEVDQRIIEYDLNGNPTGRELNIPSQLQRDKIVYNYGFEALTYDAKQKYFWTMTETTLPADGTYSNAQRAEIKNKLRLVAFDKTLNPAASYIYEMDETTKHSKSAFTIHGVSAITALDDGSLVVMEREAYMPKRKFGSRVVIKLYRVYPSEGKPIDLSTPMSQIQKEVFLHKELLTTFTTHLRIGNLNFANYEGICPGPRLTDGSKTLILLSDSQGGYHNAFYTMKDYIKIVIIKK